jgi:superfamily II DNA or RNA helicase
MIYGKYLKTTWRWIKMKDKIEKTLSGLKDFQLKTVEYVFDQLYNKNRHKMLVADEVGLGKTIVAKGVVAKAYERYMNQGGPHHDNPTFNVVYICSNLALAAQNIRKLNFTEDKNNVDPNIDRLIYLSFKPSANPPVFLINSLTPGTSFAEKSHQGAAQERAIIFSLLTEYQVFKNRENDLRWILQGKVETTRWKQVVKFHYENRKNQIRYDLFGKFRQALREEVVTSERFPRVCNFLSLSKEISFWEAIMRVCRQINGKHQLKINIQSEIIRNLRHILSSLCLQYLGADIFILDEFQRYSNLIKLDEEAENPAIEMARAVFSIKDAKILMLSATPFKPFTNDFDELNGEIHYKEFEAVLKFLLHDRSDDFWQKFRTDRKDFFTLLRHPKMLETNFDDAFSVKERLEERYRDCMVRTERLMASEDRDAMISSMLQGETLALNPADIEDFVSIDKITQYLNANHNSQLPVPLEYVKSSPFALSFLDNYQHRKKLEECLSSDKKLQKLLRKTSSAWLNLENINNYKPLIPRRSKKLPNAKLRLLLDSTLDKIGWKLLWIPPTARYYDFQGAFKDGEKFSKTLIFSSWLLVPRMVSSLVSYEAERLSIGDPRSISDREKQEGARTYFVNKGKKRSPRPQFNFAVERGDDEPRQLAAFSLLYPSPTLSAIYDPAMNISQHKSLMEIRFSLKTTLLNLLNKSEIHQFCVESGDWHKWFWAAPLLIDRASENKTLIDNWLIKGLPNQALSTDADDDSNRKAEASGKSIHFQAINKAFHDPTGLQLPKLNKIQMDEVVEYLINLCLGSPAICYLRSQLRSFPMEDKMLDCSFDVASGFITLFNKPESIAVVRLTTNSKEYADKVLEYSIDGNIQSMLDEYIYMVINCENISIPDEISNHITDILSVRTSSIDVDDLSSFTKNALNKNEKKKKHSLRTHYALDFNSQKLQSSKYTPTYGNQVITNGNLGRQVSVRQAFNSPFRPFVLATTSIGQEGLDFHFYCSKIFHWNLPSNPIDFEQREGRIHRYMGMVIRQNIARKYMDELVIDSPNKNIWKSLFKIASREKLSSRGGCELVPFWHTEPIDNMKIERYVPIYPFSRDIERYRQLLKVLAYYRLTFGQPRQAELIDALQEGKLDKNYNEKLEQLMINLSPIRFM